MSVSDAIPRREEVERGQLGLYVHVPFCKHACPYCDFYKLELRDHPARTRIEYPALLAIEHQLLLDAHPGLAARPLESLYFGGGTPSVLSPAGVTTLIRRLEDRHCGPAAEVTLEANPENLTPARCAAWRAAGITRLSVGVQSFHERDLARLERLHEPQTIASAVRNARAAGIANLSLDLMFGLPGQSLEEWKDNLRRAVALEPEHLSFYGLTIHEHTPFHGEQAAGRLALPTDEEQAAMYLWGAESLESAGFEHYEISNFARPGFRSRHNQRYWRGEDVVGLGPGAHSSLGSLRWANPEDLAHWQVSTGRGSLSRSEPESLPPEAEREEGLFRQLRRREGFECGYDDGPSAVVAAWLETSVGIEAIRHGWIQRDGAAARLTREGWLRSDAILLSMIGTTVRPAAGKRGQS